MHHGQNVRYNCSTDRGAPVRQTLERIETLTKSSTSNGTRFGLPEGFSTKDIQALAGFLITLVPVDYSYLIDSGRSVYFAADRGADVRLESVELVTQSEADAQAKASREAYDAKKAAKADA